MTFKLDSSSVKVALPQKGFFYKNLPNYYPEQVDSTQDSHSVHFLRVETFLRLSKPLLLKKYLVKIQRQANKNIHQIWFQPNVVYVM